MDALTAAVLGTVFSPRYPTSSQRKSRRVYGWPAGLLSVSLQYRAQTTTVIIVLQGHREEHLGRRSHWAALCTAPCCAFVVACRGLQGTTLSRSQNKTESGARLALGFTKKKTKHEIHQFFMYG